MSKIGGGNGHGLHQISPIESVEIRVILYNKMQIASIRLPSEISRREVKAPAMKVEKKEITQPGPVACA